jgi:N-acetylneuraminic acid mutarotase
LPSPLTRLASATVGGQIVILGGIRNGGTTAIADAIIPANGQARRDGLLASPVHDSAAGLINGRPVLFGGGAGATTDVVQMLQLGGVTKVIGHLPQRRADNSATQVGNTVYIVGGYDGTALTPDVLATTDGAQFRVVGRLSQPVRYPAAAASGDRVFVVGGATSGGESAGVDTNVVQQVDVRTGQVSVLARLPATLSHASAVTLGGQIYVLGGHVGGRWSDQVARLDTTTGALTVVGHLPRAVSDSAVTVVGNTAYLLGGERAPSTPVADVVLLTI